MPILSIALGDSVQLPAPATPPSVTAVQPAASRAVGRASASRAVAYLATTYLKMSMPSQNDSERFVQVPCLCM